MERGGAVFLVCAALAVIGGVAALEPTVRGCPDRERHEGEPMGACRAYCYFENRMNRWVEAFFVKGTPCTTRTGESGACEEGFCVGGATPTKSKETTGKPKEGVEPTTPKTPVKGPEETTTKKPRKRRRRAEGRRRRNYYKKAKEEEEEEAKGRRRTRATKSRRRRARRRNYHEETKGKEGKETRRGGVC
uniref:BTSP n=1 Tax=Ornithodoros coriaceus TaxID=92741 RepID=B2D2C4_ORNCO|nr:BTSP [Ornithodoros coriaceus]